MKLFKYASGSGRDFELISDQHEKAYALVNIFSRYGGRSEVGCGQ